MGTLNPNLKPPAQKDLEDFLKTYIKGQPQAIGVLAERYAAFKGGITKFSKRNEKRPIGVFLFLGPAGTGKTQIGRVLAQKFHGTPEAVTLIDCVSYQERHEIASLIGAPPGYVGYEDKPLLSKEKLYAKIPGYQINPSPGSTQNRKQEEETEDDDVRVDEVFTFWLNQFDLIDECLRNIEHKFSKFRKLNLSPKEWQKIKTALSADRKALYWQRIDICDTYIRLVKNFMASRHSSQDRTTTPPPKLTASPFKLGDRQIKITEPAKAARLTPATADIKIKEEPTLVIIFDEIEKAHDSVRQWLMHLMEEGRAVLRNGVEVDLSRAFIILTSNIGSKLLAKAAKGVAGIGFRPAFGKTDVEKMAKAELKKLYSPEFLRRIDEIVVFNLLSRQDFRDILDLEIDNLALFLAKERLDLAVEQPVKEFILEEAFKRQDEQIKALQDAFKKYLDQSVGNLKGTGQLADKKKLTVSFDPKKKQIIFET